MEVLESTPYLFAFNSKKLLLYKIDNETNRASVFFDDVYEQCHSCKQFKLAYTDTRVLMMLKISKNEFLILKNLTSVEPSELLRIQISGGESRDVIDYDIVQYKEDQITFCVMYEGNQVEIIKANLVEESWKLKSKTTSELKLDSESFASSFQRSNKPLPLVTAFSSSKGTFQIYEIESLETLSLKLVKSFGCSYLKKCSIVKKYIFGISKSKGFYNQMYEEEEGKLLDFGENIQDFHLLVKEKRELWVLGENGSVKRFE